MKKLLVFSVSILCLSLALAIVLHQLGEFAIASSTAPMATEVVTATGVERVSTLQTLTIPWPTYADGTQATVSECHGIASRSREFGSPLSTMNYTVSETVAGFSISNSSDDVDFLYLIVCTRSAGGPVAAEQSTWGEIKSLYGE